MVGVSPSKVLAPFRASPVPFRFVVSRLSFALGRLSFFSFPLLLRRSSLFSPFTLSRTAHTHTHNVVLAWIPSRTFIIFFALLLFFTQPLSRQTLVVSRIHVFLWTRCTVPTIVSSTRRTERDCRPHGIVKNFPCNRRETRSLW